MCKKSLKKNKFSINAGLDTYKSEFLKNVDVTRMANVFESNLFTVGSNNTKNIFKIDNIVFFKNAILHNTFFKALGLFKLEEVFTHGKYVFLDFDKGDLFSKNIFKKLQKFNDNKNNTNNPLNNIIKTWDFTNDESYKLFFKNLLLDKITLNTIQHPELDDDTRIIKRNLGKNTPLRLLKLPKTDFFLKDQINEKFVELFRFRFNERVSTTANKPIKTTVYLTFKQKRYNQRNNIVLKNINYLDKNTKKIQKYSGNPFLKNMSIIEDNFGNPTRQYRMIKKNKVRVDNTRVGN